MEFVVIFSLIAVLVGLAFLEQSSYRKLQRKGISVTGVIVANVERESADKDLYRMGGNINEPTVTFSTVDGKEITGRPIVGFVTQYQLNPPVPVIIVYNPRKPEQFTIDFERSFK